MNVLNAIVPVATVDEEAEFQAMNARRDNRAKSAMEAENARQERKNEAMRKAEAKKRQKINNAIRFVLGAFSTTCAVGVIVALRDAPEFAIFPAILAVIAAGVAIGR